MVRRTLTLSALALALGLAPAIPTAGEAFAQRGSRSARGARTGSGGQGTGRTAAGGEVGRPGNGSNPSVNGANQFSRRAARSAARDRTAMTEGTSGAPQRQNPRSGAQETRRTGQPRSGQPRSGQPRTSRPQQTRNRQQQAQRQAMAQAQAERQALVREVSTFQRLRARTTQIRSLAISVVTGIGGAVLSKFAVFFGGGSALGKGFQEFGSLMGDPGFGNPIASFMGPEVAIGAAIGAGLSIAVGTIRAARLRSQARRIESGDEQALQQGMNEMAQGARGGQLNPYLAPESLPDTVWPFQNN